MGVGHGLGMVLSKGFGAGDMAENEAVGGRRWCWDGMVLGWDAVGDRAGNNTGDSAGDEAADKDGAEHGSELARGSLEWD